MPGKVSRVFLMAGDFSSFTFLHGQLLIAAGAAIIYGIVWLPQGESVTRALMKVVPMALLIIVALFGGLPPLITAGLGACAVGDWFLAYEDEKSFHTGLGAFLAGHLFFIGHFLTTSGFNIPLTGDTAMLAFLLAALVGMVLLRLWPFLDHMKLPVTAYALIIAIMAFTAKLAMPGTIVLAGISLFMLSDILLAQDKFTPLTNSPVRRAMPWLVWAFYFGGQTLIVYGLLVRIA